MPLRKRHATSPASIHSDIKPSTVVSPSALSPLPYSYTALLRIATANGKHPASSSPSQIRPRKTHRILARYLHLRALFACSRLPAVTERSISTASAANRPASRSATS